MKTPRAAAVIEGGSRSSGGALAAGAPSHQQWLNAGHRDEAALAAAGAAVSGALLNSLQRTRSHSAGENVALLITRFPYREHPGGSGNGGSSNS